MWSKQHECCIECGTTETKHKAKGFCVNCYHKLRRKNLGEKHRQYQREYKKRPHVKARIKKYGQRPEVKARRREDSRRWRERNPERALEVLKNWRERNPDKIKAYSARPEVKERSRRRWINKKYGESGFVVLERDSYLCRKCGSPKQIQIHHKDWNKANNDLDNLILFCNSCHQKLHAFIPKRFRLEILEEWLVS